jgi:release factor glutamine methyltransferase
MTKINLTSAQIALLLRNTLKEYKYPENYVNLLCKFLSIAPHEEKLADNITISRLNHVLECLKKDIPVEYIVGEAEFYDLTLKVNASTLIPRPFTEGLVEEVLKVRENATGKVCIIDIGTGSGAIIIAVMNALRSKPGLFSQTTAIATDISATALAIAKLNAQQYNLESFINFVNADVTNPLDGDKFPDLDPFNEVIIVSNPPYIREDVYSNLQKSVKDYEPKSALVRNEDFYKKLQLFEENLRKSGKNVTVILEDSDETLIPFLVIKN